MYTLTGWSSVIISRIGVLTIPCSPHQPTGYHRDQPTSWTAISTRGGARVLAPPPFSGCRFRHSPYRSVVVRCGGRSWASLPQYPTFRWRGVRTGDSAPCGTSRVSRFAGLRLACTLRLRVCVGRPLPFYCPCAARCILHIGTTMTGILVWRIPTDHQPWPRTRYRRRDRNSARPGSRPRFLPGMF